MKFKEKLKSFFNVDLEKDLQEEEPTKVFEKTPLITLTRNKIFLAIFSFLIIVNCLVGFDLDFLYLRQILGFLFLILVPGLLIMLCFKIRTVKFWEYLVYTIGLSVAFIMFAGLAVNWILPWLEITDQPLSLWPILICFNIFFVILGMIAWIRNMHLQPFDLTVPKLDTINNIFFIIPMIFPILSVLGAFILNNHGSNILTMIMLGGIAVYVLLLVIFRKKMNENIWPWAVWMISISLLLMFSLRSMHISGWDINVEYEMFKLTKENYSWSILNFRDAYNGCLSITIFPTVFYFFVKYNLEFIFKLFFQVIFSFVPLILFLFLKKFSNHIIIFLSSFFFMSLIWFIQEFPTLIRQEIAFLFFGLMLLVLFTKQLNPKIKKVLFVIFGVSMIVSHYSTSYIALTIFILTYIFTLLYKIYENRKIKKRKLHPSQKSNFHLTGVLILLLILFGFLWYNQITPTSNGLIDFAKKSFDNMGNIFKEELGVSAKNAFLINVNSNTQEQIENYTQSIIQNYNEKNPPIEFYDKISYINYKITPLNSKLIKPIITSSKVISILFYLFKIIKFLINQIFISVGIFFFYYFLFFKKHKLNKEFVILSLVGALLVVAMLFLPTASNGYNLERIYQQVLIFLSLTTILGAIISFKFLRNNARIIFISIIFILLFLFYSGFIFNFIGGNSIMSLNNFGTDYNQHYTHNSQVKSAQWMLNNYNNKYGIYSDKFASLRLFAFAKIYNSMGDILPQIIDKKAYVYTSYTNTIYGITFKPFNGITLSYNFPTEFLNDNKNKVYNNGGSEIFK